MAATDVRESPTRVMVGAIVRGPMYRNSKPMPPKAPTATSTRDATIMDPWIYNIQAFVASFPTGIWSFHDYWCDTLFDSIALRYVEYT